MTKDIALQSRIMLQTFEWLGGGGGGTDLPPTIKMYTNLNLY